MSAIETDVLVLGGGPAGAWAAVSAAALGVRVVLVDKQRVGIASAAWGHRPWQVPPGAARDAAIRQAHRSGGELGDPDEMHRILDETCHRLGQLAAWGRHGGRANYFHALRRRLHGAGVRVLEYHPVLQLLVDRDGVVAGATGLRADHQQWTVRAGAVVLATGGCDFLAGGSDIHTGDGLLCAAEAGAQLSGMEFSSAYDLVSAVGTPVTFEKYYDDAGTELTDHAAALDVIALGHRVYGALGDLGGPAGAVDSFGWGPTAATAGSAERVSGAGAAVSTGRMGAAAPAGRVSAGEAAGSVGRVPLRPVLRGTVGGAGGLLTGADGATTVDGLYAAGDAAARESILGAAHAAGGQGGAWAIASGVWAGAGAARCALERGVPTTAHPVPGAGLNSRSRIDPRAVVGLVQEHTLPLRRSYWRSAGSLRDSIAELDALWPGAVLELGGAGPVRLQARQAAALLAVARWTKYSALARTESRGMHRRTDHPGAAQDWRVRLTSGGLDRIWVRTGADSRVQPVRAARLPVPRGRRPDSEDHDVSPDIRRGAGQLSGLATVRSDREVTELTGFRRTPGQESAVVRGELAAEPADRPADPGAAVAS
ncbi:FAD-binding protein [Nocardia sp. NPDC127579]|uniref:FAD-binding protein n=1 Tax=Nocardia sp. NPDC127579 TaxID=3345402 RepID=UPI0036404CB5